ncbi:MAG: OsmC family protein [Opitutaceae bacterium]|nr:OsmC family protein [Opitutaceae bacterium]
MVKSTGIYQGELNCALTHGPSGQVIATDAPVDNQGRGQAFSPTDLTAASLGACIVTTMAIVARSRLGFELPAVKWEVTKEMSADAPRRIARIGTELWLSIPRSRDAGGVLERAAQNCPVHRSLHPEIDRPIVFHWADEA